MSMLPHAVYRLNEATGQSPSDLLGGTSALLGSVWMDTNAVSGPTGDTRTEKGLSFDGTTDRMLLGVLSNSADSQKTISVRCKPSNVSATTTAIARRVISYHSGGTAHAALGFDNSKLTMWVRSGGAGSAYVGSPTITNNVECYVTIVIDKVNGFVKGYYNDQEHTSASVTMDAISSPTRIGIGAGIGAVNPTIGLDAHFNRFFAGEIYGDIIVSNYAWSPEEVAARANGQVWDYFPTKAGRHCISCQAQRTGISDQNMVFYAETASGVLLQQNVLGFSDYDSAGYTRVGFGYPVQIDDIYVDDVCTIACYPASGSTADPDLVLPIEPITEYGVVKRWADNQHTAPPIYKDNDDIYEVVTEIGTYNAYIYQNGLPIVDENNRPMPLFTGVSDSVKETYDTYHHGSVIWKSASGWHVLKGDHNRQMQIVSATGINDLFSASVIGATSSSSPYLATYISVNNSYTSDEICYMFRAIDQLHIRFNKPFTTPSTFVTEVISDNDTNNDRPYPRNLELMEYNGEDYLWWCAQNRDDDTGRWCETYGGFRDSSGQITNIMGVPIGDTANGTITAPKLTNSEAFLTAYDATGNPESCQLLPRTLNGNRYSAQMSLPRMTGPGIGDVFLIFTDTTDVEQASAENLQVRCLFYKGSSGEQFITSSGSDPFGLDNGPSYRLTSDAWWKENNPDTNIVECVIGLPEDSDTLPTSDYYGFGTTGKIYKYSVDLNNVSSDEDLDNAVELVEILDDISTDYFAVIQQTNVPGLFAVDRAVYEIHPTLRVGTPIGTSGENLYDFSFTGTPPTPYVSGQINELYKATSNINITNQWIIEEQDETNLYNLISSRGQYTSIINLSSGTGIGQINQSYYNLASHTSNMVYDVSDLSMSFLDTSRDINFVRIKGFIIENIGTGTIEIPITGDNFMSSTFSNPENSIFIKPSSIFCYTNIVGRDISSDNRFIPIHNSGSETIQYKILLLGNG